MQILLQYSKVEKGLFASMRHGLILYLLSLILLTPIGAQSDLKIGQWDAHLPYSAGTDVTQSESEVIYSTSQALMYIDKQDLSRRFVSKVNGLSSTGIRKIQYNQASQTLIVAYESGLIDLIRNGNTTPQTQIVDFNNFPITKKINDISDESENTVLISADFGVMRLDLDRGSFPFTTFTNQVDVKVNAAVRRGSEIWIATTNGVYRIDDNGINNLLEFSQWEHIGEDYGLPQEYSSSDIALFDGLIWMDVDGELFSGDDMGFELSYSYPDYRCNFLNQTKGELIAGFSCNSGCSSETIRFLEDGMVVPEANFCTDRASNAIKDEQGRIWYADNYRDFRYLLPGNQSCERTKINSPWSKRISEVEHSGNSLYIAHGGVTDNFDYLFRMDGISYYEGDEWTILNQTTVPLFKDKNMLDFFRVKVHPDGRVFFGTYWGGLIEYKEGAYTVYDTSNSTLQGAIGDEQRVRISGLAVDREGNLWVANTTTPEPLSVLTPDGEWKSFELDGAGGQVSEIAIDGSGNKWIVMADNSSGLTVFHEGDMDIEGDEQVYVFKAGNSILESNQVFCVEADLDGQIWAGTNAGPVVFDNCGSLVFSGDCYGNRRKVDLGGDIEFLLSTEVINSIGIDGANRKWFGTLNGVFVQDPIGETELAKFNTNNSPILSDWIIDIAFNEENGEVYIATNEGLSVYRSDAVFAGNDFENELVAFPNPVRPGYSGPIAIKGMSRDARVKITDVRGRLVYESISNGGQTIWDGRNFDGEEVASGVYLIFANEDDSNSLTKPGRAKGKLLIVR